MVGGDKVLDCRALKVLPAGTAGSRKGPGQGEQAAPCRHKDRQQTLQPSPEKHGLPVLMLFFFFSAFILNSQKPTAHFCLSRTVKINMGYLKSPRSWSFVTAAGEVNSPSQADCSFQKWELSQQRQRGLRLCRAQDVRCEMHILHAAGLPLLHGHSCWDLEEKGDSQPWLP